MTDDDRDYEVGYGKPPKSGQFKPRRSGNPAGRPPKKRQLAPPYAAGLTPFDQAMLEEEARVLRLREGDHAFELTQGRAAIRSTYAKAIKGSPMAQRTIFEETRRVQELELRRRQAIWDSYQSYVASWHKAAARAAAQGQPPPCTLPHPDDIEFGDDLTIHLNGPTDAEELKRYRTIADFRDLFFSMHVYGVRRGRLPDEDDQNIDWWAFASTCLNSRLPPSLRLSSDEILATSTKLTAMRLRKLEEHISGLCSRVDWTLKIALHLARRCSTIDMHLLGFQPVGGAIVREPRLTHAKLERRFWSGRSFEKLTIEKLDLIERVGLQAPSWWMTEARAAIAAREGTSSATS